MTKALATCRIQLRNGLTFDHLIDRLDYLHTLGISHLYLSPIFTATSGSTHGYDCVDPNAIDPVLGGEAGFKRLCDAIRDLDMGLILDIVPNHLGVGADNPYWHSLLREGPNGQDPAVFDVDWQSLAGGTPGKLLLPILGEPLSTVLEKNQLRINADDEPVLQYFEHEIPLAPGSNEESKPIEAVLADQHWRLAWWRGGNRLLNWRRFFDITTLAGVRVEDPAVFELTHQKIFELLKIDVVQGLRIDHIDGLAKPGEYLDRLDQAWRERRSDEPWILIEKILAPHESLPVAWATDGTTGYETLNRLTSVFIHPEGAKALEGIWTSHGQSANSFQAELASAKREILTVNLAAELNRLALQVCQHPLVDFTPEHVCEGLVQLVIATNCYRSYGNQLPQAFDQAMKTADWSTTPAALPVTLAAAMPPDGELRSRFEQLSAPAMAKSLEDTVFYRWFPVLALNEVGGEPDHFSTPTQLHEAFADQARTRPKAMIATATHDTKRGEDARVRLTLLTHPNLRWPAQLSAWRDLIAPLVQKSCLDEKTLLFILQTVYSVWPIEDRGEQTPEKLLPRLNTYFTKALREAKGHTSWLNPNEVFETEIHNFVAQLLACEAFKASINLFVEAIQPAAQRVSLGITTLKYCLPGVPDLYHGCEALDLSLVDPDNRRPVDLDRLRAQLAAPSESADASNAKQALIHRLLHLRKQKTKLFGLGTYRAIQLPNSDGPLFAFERRHAEDRMLVIINRWPQQADQNELRTSLGSLHNLLAERSWYDVVSQQPINDPLDSSLAEALSHWSACALVNPAAG